MTRLLKTEWLLIIICSLGCGAAHVGTTSSYISWSERGVMRENIAPFATVDSKDISPSQRMRLGLIFTIDPRKIESFRWGYSLSPEGSEQYGWEWYRIVCDQNEAKTLYVTNGGKIVDRRVERERRAPMVKLIFWLSNGMRLIQ